MTTEEAARVLLDSITDEMLTRPSIELTPYERDIIKVVLMGPLAGELMERLDNLS